MKVKLSYTADIEDVLTEASYLLANLGAKVKDSIGLFNNLILLLREEEFKSKQFFEEVEALRRNLAALDSRLAEVDEVVEGFQEYERNHRKGEAPPPAPPNNASVVEPEESTPLDD
jgi:ABC-type transporter Mla subunit MlaD